MNKLSLPRLLCLLVLPAALLISGCGDDPEVTPIVEDQNLVKNHPAEIQVAWKNVFLHVERYAAGYRPGPAPRSLAYMGLAAYEACITGMPGYNSMRGRYAGLALPEVDPNVEYHWPTVVHGVYTEMMPRFFLQPQADAKVHWDGVVSEYNARFLAEAGQARFNASLAYGRAVGEAMWNYAVTDPYGHDAYKNPFGNFTTNETYRWQDHYRGPGDWVATFPGPGDGMGPFFGRARAFAISGEEKVARTPGYYWMHYSTNPQSEYYAQAIQVYTKNAAQDYATEWIGEFWSDDLLNLTFSPGPRWVAVANQVIEREKSHLETALETYAKVGLALNDAAVGCWHSKYLYNIERPVTFINAHIDPNYKTNLYNPLTGEDGISPSFPAYPSGHSTMGAAGAEALASVFGYAYGMTDRCHQGRTQFEGTPRTFGSFREMAEENAWSRVLLGVHWRMDCDEGMRFGTEIGRKINNLPWKR